MQAQSPNGSNGYQRTASGQFAIGTCGGPGNPHAKRSAQIRSLILGTVSDDDLRAIIGSLVEQAKAGDLAAAREILDRTIGRAPQGIYQATDTGEPSDLMTDAQARERLVSLFNRFGLGEALPPSWRETAHSGTDGEVN